MEIKNLSYHRFEDKDLMSEIYEPRDQTRGLFKKIIDTKGTFHAKMGTINDRNGMDLTEADDIKKTWQDYTELQKKRSS